MISTCSDGCCSETISTVYLDDDEDVIGPVLFDVADLKQYLIDRFGKDWDDDYWIDVEHCEFY
jgi:hypothetical protein